MAPLSMRLAMLLVITLLGGCNLMSKKNNVARGKDFGKPIKADPKPLELVSTSTRDAPLPDPATMIPPPPTLDVPEIPAAPPRETELVSAPTEPAATVSAGGARPKGVEVRPPSATEAKETNLEACTGSQAGRREVQFARRLRGPVTRGRPSAQGVTGGSASNEVPPPAVQPARQMGRPGEPGAGNDLRPGKNKGEVQILTGRHEGLLIPSGKRVSFAPTDSQVRSKCRYDIREGGMGMSLDWFGRVLAIMDKDPRQANRMKYVGVKPRREREAGLDAVEEIIPPDWEPLLPRGGRRTTYFDPDPASPSFGLPILITTMGDNGREVEYYWFDGLKPTKFTDADFDPDRLWKK